MTRKYKRASKYAAGKASNIMKNLLKIEKNSTVNYATFKLLNQVYRSLILLRNIIIIISQCIYDLVELINKNYFITIIRRIFVYIRYLSAKHKRKA